VLHERHDRAAEGRRLLAPLDDAAHARRRRGNPLGLGVSSRTSILPVVPMFHANAWGYPYLAAMLGAKLVYPGPHLDPESLLDDFVAGGVTWTAGVPTIWLGILQLLDANPASGTSRG
jgi:acyl-CoA synthetase (AMP-forming)/AMP-acid ligase II